MKYIRSIKTITPKRPNGRTIVYMLGYGGFTWQSVRQLRLLRRKGYKIIALDFAYILRNCDPQELIGLMDEVDELFKKRKLINSELIMVGISLGGLVCYNMLRRHPELKRMITITGGDIVSLPSSKSLAKKWKITREDLAEKWKSVNIYTPVGVFENRKAVILLPLRDKLINPQASVDEIAVHRPFNDVTVIRTKGGHNRTIITETILRPNRIIGYLAKLD